MNIVIDTLRELCTTHPSQYSMDGMTFTQTRNAWVISGFRGSVKQAYANADRLADLLRERLQGDSIISIDRDLLAPAIYIEPSAA